MNPYIGVVGFTNKYEVLSALNAFPENTNRKAMIGVLASINGRVGQVKYCQKLQNLKHIFQSHPRALNLVHFRSTELNPELLYQQLLKVKEMAGPYCHGLQLNMSWPDPKALVKLAAQSEKMVIVLEAWTRPFDFIDHPAQVLAEKVAEYEHLIDYVLLDPIGGSERRDANRPLDPSSLRPFLQALTKRRLHMGLGVAGNLSPSRMHLVAPLVKEFPNISFHAEGRLRDGFNNLDSMLVNAFISKSIDLLEP